VGNGIMDKNEWETRTAKIGEMIRVIAEDIFRELPLQHLAIIQLVAERPGITQPEISETLKMPQATTSRNVSKLSVHVVKHKGTWKDRGYGILKVEPDSADSRKLACFLSQKGERFWERLLAQF